MKNVIAIQIFGNHNANSAAFKQSVVALSKAGFGVDVITTKASAQVLADVQNVNMHTINHKALKTGRLNIFSFLSIQIMLIIKTIKMISHGDIVYINSVYSIAPALIAKIKRAKVIFHANTLHVNQGLGYKILKGIINSTANQAIFPSASLRDEFALSVNKQTIIYNSLTFDFITQNIPTQRNLNHNKFNVLMVSRSDAQQNINNCLELAAKMPNVNFDLLLTDFPERKTLNLLLANYRPSNLNVCIEKCNRADFYQKANLLINLSPAREQLAADDKHVLEAMYYGIPVIVPSVGGLRELISNGKHGAAIDIDHLYLVAQTITSLSNNNALYQQLSIACIQQAQLFNPLSFNKQLIRLFKGQKVRAYDNLIQLFGTAYLNSSILLLNNTAA